MICDPRKPHIEAIELLNLYLQGDPSVCENRDPFQPRFGVNFVGPPGCGKTHIMSAFARRMKEYHDKKLEGYQAMVLQFVNREYVAYQKAIADVSNPNQPTSVWKIESTRDAGEEALLEKLKLGETGEPSAKRPPLMAMASLIAGKLVEEKDPATVFLEKLTQHREALRRMQYQPPDLLYLDFDALWELYRTEGETRSQVLAAIERAKVLFLDDVHPKGDSERVQIVLHVIEGRYAAGQMGTFMTTNLTTDELAGKDERIADRLKSRCSEMFYEVSFQGCDDWRTKVKRRRIDLAREHLERRIASLIKPEQTG
jgi:DNA polymerase III delta prime subunit